MSSDKEDSSSSKLQKQDTKKSDTFNGQVKWFNENKGYGFIQKHVKNNEEPVEIFVHYTNINDVKILYEGEHVVFEEMECSDKGVQAKAVRAPSDGKLMHKFKFENNSMPQKRNVQFNNNYNDNFTQLSWDSMYMKNLSDELNKYFNKGGESKGKGKGKYNNGDGNKGKGNGKEKGKGKNNYKGGNNSDNHQDND